MERDEKQVYRKIAQVSGIAQAEETPCQMGELRIAVVKQSRRGS